MTRTLNQRYPLFDKRDFTLVIISIFAIILVISSCRKDPDLPDPNLPENGTTPYLLKIPNYVPPMPIPKDNPLTVEGVELGRHLFYEPLLSGNNQQSCASCHLQSSAFVDGNNRFSKGIDGFDGFRNSMPLLNLGWGERFFWDGKAASLEDLISIPIMAEFEMHENIRYAITELEEVDKYRRMFAAAFGDDDITEERIQRSVAQFLRTMIGFNMKLAPVNIGKLFRTPQEELGFQVFLDENKGDCFHCHTSTLLNTNYEFMNNGLNADPSTDPGHYSITGNPADMGKFRVPSLYNLKFTAPYMHDGRFNTLEEVLDFYDIGFHVSPTLDLGVAKHADSNGKPIPRTWTQQDKQNLLVFLRSLTDTTIMTNPAFSKPD